MVRKVVTCFMTALYCPFFLGTDRQTDRHTDRHRQLDREIDRQIYSID